MGGGDQAELDERTQHVSIRSQETLVKLVVERAKQGLRMVSFEDKQAFLEGWEVQAVVAGEDRDAHANRLHKRHPMSLGARLDAALLRFN